MSRRLLGGFLAAAFFVSCGGDAARNGPEGLTGSNLKLRRGRQPTGIHPRKADVERVFDALRAVARQPEQRRPRLLPIETDTVDPWAVARDDGGIELSVQAIDLCYRDRDTAAGDARIGFVLAHELAHLASEHFQHLEAYFAVQGLPDGLPRGKLAETLALSPETLRSRELLADQTALVYLTVAGIDPAPVLRDERFFEDFSSQALREEAFADLPHPSPAERVRFLRRGLQPVLDRLPLFDWGVRLYQVGRFQDAIDFLTAFKSVFAGPAVLNNLALSHLQKGLSRAVDVCPDEPFELRLPGLAVDPETLARRMVFRGSGETCLKGDPDLAEAARLLEEAVQFPTAGPHAGINRCAALLAGRRAPEAHLCAWKLLETQATPEAELLEIQAGFLFSRESEMIDSGKILGALEALARSRPDSALIAYNHAAIAEADGRPAQPLWRRFLELEAEGAYADHARRRLGEAVPAGGPPPPTRPPPELTPPILPGPVADSDRALLGGWDSGPDWELGGGSWRQYRDETWSALYRLPGEGDPGGVVALARGAPEAWTAEELKRRHGPPAHVVPGRDGEFLRYAGFGFDVREGRAVSLTIFQPK